MIGKSLIFFLCHHFFHFCVLRISLGSEVPSSFRLTSCYHLKSCCLSVGIEIHHLVNLIFYQLSWSSQFRNLTFLWSFFVGHSLWWNFFFVQSLQLISLIVVVLWRMTLDLTLQPTQLSSFQYPISYPISSFSMNPTQHAPHSSSLYPI